jgi:hypothetical protein
MHSDIQLSVPDRNSDPIVIICAVFEEPEKAVQLILGIQRSDAKAVRRRISHEIGYIVIRKLDLTKIIINSYQY